MLGRTLLRKSAAALCCLVAMMAADTAYGQGACCAPNPNGAVSCTVTTEIACAAAQGHWLGAGTSCTSASCLVTTPSGACCLTASTAPFVPCVVGTEAQCANTAGGVWHGVGSTCGSSTPNTVCNPAPATGACCASGFAGPLCLISTEAQCAVTTGGVYKGNNTVCTTTLCNPTPVTGACCAVDPTTGTTGCSVTTFAQCSGAWHGAGTTCGTDTCPQPAPTGACCASGFAGPVCFTTTATQCAAATGGVYQGNNTICTATLCNPTPVTGACCLVNSAAGAVSCTITTQAQCNGTWRGANTICNLDACPQPTPTGACCTAGAAALTCTVTTQTVCTGTWKGVNTVCSNDICVPRGACCYTSAGTTAVVCQVLTQANCTAHQGVFSANAASCVPFPCVQPVRGSCCLPLSTSPTSGAVCIVTTAADCATRHGTYGGDNNVCTSSTCPQPTPRGACCTASAAGVAACSILTQADCTAANGSYRGNATSCSNDICVPRGACCNPSIVTSANTNCVVTTQLACANLQGTWQTGVTCDAAACPPPPARGACCVSSANGLFCTVRTPAQCTAANGVYRGDGTPCSLTACPRPCVCDWDHSGSITQADLHAYLTDFLAGNADITGDGHTDINDLTAFVDCFQHPPASCSAGGPPILIGGDGAPVGSNGAGRD